MKGIKFQSIQPCGQRGRNRNRTECKLDPPCLMEPHPQLFTIHSRSGANTRQGFDAFLEQAASTQAEASWSFSDEGPQLTHVEGGHLAIQQVKVWRGNVSRREKANIDTDKRGEGHHAAFLLNLKWECKFVGINYFSNRFRTPHAGGCLGPPWADV